MPVPEYRTRASYLTPDEKTVPSKNPPYYGKLGKSSKFHLNSAPYVGVEYALHHVTRQSGSPFSGNRH